MAFAGTIVVMVIALAVCWRFLGAYMVSVYEARAKWLSWLEKPIYRVLRVDQAAEQTWPRYAASVIVFSGVALLITYGILRLQGYLPLNPQNSRQSVPTPLGTRRCLSSRTLTGSPMRVRPRYRT